MWRITGIGIATDGSFFIDMDIDIDIDIDIDSLVRLGTSLVLLGTSLVRSGTSLVRSGTSLVRPGTGLVRSGASLVWLGTGLVVECKSCPWMQVLSSDASLVVGRKSCFAAAAASASASAACTHPSLSPTRTGGQYM